MTATFFALVIEKVSGVGPKVAISLMSKLPLGNLISAISSEDANLLAKTPGIGKKTAERIIIELKDKLTIFASASQSIELTSVNQSVSAESEESSKLADAALALQALGYKQIDAKKAISKVVEKLGPNISTEAMIKAALG